MRERLNSPTCVHRKLRDKNQWRVNTQMRGLMQFELNEVYLLGMLIACFIYTMLTERRRLFEVNLALINRNAWSSLKLRWSSYLSGTECSAKIMLSPARTTAASTTACCLEANSFSVSANFIEHAWASHPSRLMCSHHCSRDAEGTMKRTIPLTCPTRPEYSMTNTNELLVSISRLIEVDTHKAVKRMHWRVVKFTSQRN